MCPHGPVHILYWKWGESPFGAHVYMTEALLDAEEKGNHALVDESTGFYIV